MYRLVTLDGDGNELSLVNLDNDRETAYQAWDELMAAGIAKGAAKAVLFEDNYPARSFQKVAEREAEAEAPGGDDGERPATDPLERMDAFERGPSGRTPGSAKKTKVSKAGAKADG